MWRKRYYRNRSSSIIGLMAILWSLPVLFFTKISIGNTLVPSGHPYSTAHLYFTATDKMFLTAEERRLPHSNDPAEFGKVIIEALIAGPQQNLIRTIPKESVLNAIYITEDNCAYVDFNTAIQKDHPGGCRTETLSIYSIVNSLILNIDSIKSVKLLVGGREIQTLSGHIDSRFPFSANMLIIR